MRRLIRAARDAIADLWLRLLIAMRGKAYVLARLESYARCLGARRVLMILGAAVEPDAHIEPGLCIQNAPAGDCGRLRIGAKVYVGPEVLIDLACPVTLEEQAVLSARVCIVTHMDCGERLQAPRLPRREGPVRVGRGAFVGASAVILHGVRVGECSVVGAMSLVREDVPPHSLCVGIPARTVRRYDDDLSRRDAMPSPNEHDLNAGPKTGNA